MKFSIQAIGVFRADIWCRTTQIAGQMRAIGYAQFQELGDYSVHIPRTPARAGAQQELPQRTSHRARDGHDGQCLPIQQHSCLRGEYNRPWDGVRGPDNSLALAPNSLEHSTPPIRYDITHKPPSPDTDTLLSTSCPSHNCR